MSCFHDPSRGQLIMRHRVNNGVAALLGLVMALSATSPAAGDKPKPVRLEISITERGFVPGKLRVKKGQPVLLVFTRKTDRTCAREVVIQVTDKKSIAKNLPLDTPIEIATTFPKSGAISYACGMNMHTGV